MNKPVKEGGDLQRTAHLTLMLGVCTGVGLIWGFVMGGLPGALMWALALAAIALVFYRVLVVGGASSFTSFLLPSAPAEPTTTYGYIDALEMRGDFAGAMAAWEEAIAASPDALAARMRAAELYAGKAANPARAAQLFRELQRHPRASDDTRRFATQRLVDLFLGPLGDHESARTELRRIVERWPGTREAEGARDAIRRMDGR